MGKVLIKKSNKVFEPHYSNFRVDNLIFDADDPSKVLAVLDWELSTLGDPLADAAYGCIAHHIPADMALMKVSFY